jgi:hypothetical protein
MTALKALRTFYPSVREHRTVEKEIRRLLSDVLEARYISAEAPRTKRLSYIQRNFFSILFLTLYRSLSIPPERRIFYGTINHSVRGIVTGTDNILDDEYKEMLPIRFPEGARRFKSVMHILLFDRFLFLVLEDARAKGLLSGEEMQAVNRELFNAMVPIGEEEATEEGGVTTILPPDEILHSVHMHKGGNLLRLAIVAPLIVETDLRERLSFVDRGVYSIGMALQVIDDLTDFLTDIRDRRHNYLVSSIRHEGSPEERKHLEALLSAALTESGPLEVTYAASVSRVMERAIGEALAGFDLFHQSGFGITRDEAMDIIRYLFHLRGVKHLLSLLPDRCNTTLTTRQQTA